MQGTLTSQARQVSVTCYVVHAGCLRWMFSWSMLTAHKGLSPARWKVCSVCSGGWLPHARLPATCCPSVEGPSQWH